MKLDLNPNQPQGSRLSLADAFPLPLALEDRTLLLHYSELLGLRIQSALSGSLHSQGGQLLTLAQRQCVMDWLELQNEILDHVGLETGSGLN